jgi:hypothetical protein
MSTITRMLMTFSLALLAGCSFYARDADDYRKVTRSLLESRNADIKGCYDAELKKSPTVAGKVVVHFMVEKKTGKVTGPAVDPASTAPESLGQCVVRALDGLTLDPPDARDGDATFSWEFQLKG